LRYEHAGKFWTITRVGTALTIVAGKIGNKGRTVVKHYPSDGAATSAHDQLVLEKQREGFRIAEEPAEQPVSVVEAPAHIDLDAAIVADPDDANAYAVLGDWLQKHGDSHGELVALMQASGPKAATAVGKHLAQHAKQLLGPLAALVADVRKPDGPPLWWKHGFIRRAELASAKGYTVDAQLAQLLALPSARFLVELAIRADTRDEGLGILKQVADAPPTLRDFDLFARANLDRITWKSASLRQLGITARAFELASLDAPAVTRAKFRATSLASSTMEAIAKAPWPVLERLEIRFCGQHGSTEVDFHDTRPLLLRTDMPALTHVKLRGCPFAGTAMRTLASSPLAARLKVIDFSFGSFTPNDIEFFAKQPSVFPNLVELWMPFALLNAKTQPILAKLTKHLVPDSRAPIDSLDWDLAGESTGDDADERYDDIEE
jgi:uncharacterized protein (TIGR02996 family)